MSEMGNFKNAPMGFNKSEVNRYIAELYKKIDRLEKELANNPKGMDAVTAPKPGDAAELTELRRELVAEREKKSNLEMRLTNMQSSLDRAIDENERISAELATAQAIPAPPPQIVEVPVVNTVETVDTAAVVRDLEEGKRKLDAHYSEFTAFFAAAIASVSSVAVTPQTAAVLEPVTAAPVVVEIVSDEAAALPPETADTALDELADFTMDTPANDSTDDLNAFTDFTMDTPTDGSDDGSTDDLSAFADFTMDTPTDDSDDDLSAFADFAMDTPADDDFGEFTEFTADIAPAAGDAVTEFSRASGSAYSNTEEGFFDSGSNAEVPHGVTQNSDLSDDLSGFSDFMLTESSGIPADDELEDDGSFDLQPFGGGDSQLNTANAGEFSDDFADFMLSPDSEITIGGDDLPPAELTQIGLDADGNLDPYMQDKMLATNVGQLTAHENDDGTYSVGDNSDFELSAYTEDESDGMDDFEALMAQASAEATAVGGGNTGDEWDFSMGGDDDDMSSDGFDLFS
jgi:hypothetical protein